MLRLLITVFISISCFGLASQAERNIPCPCQNVPFCNPIGEIYEKEVFVFSTSYKDWPNYDWSKITTVVMFGDLLANWSCFAHSKNARSSFGAGISIEDLRNETARAIWVKEKVQVMQENFMDGINVDFEGWISEIDVRTREAYNRLISELTTAALKVHPQPQITIDVPWSPTANHFDYKKLSSMVDFMFLMVYDTNYQPHHPCLAGANSPSNRTVIGPALYNETEGVPYSKMVLGLPWYGYHYECIKFTQNPSEGPGTCYIKPYSSSGCSDTVGSQVSYAGIMANYAPLDPLTPRVDPNSWSAYIEYEKNSTMYQVWYDDPFSLLMKTQGAQVLNLRGVGIWTADHVDYKNKTQANAMWASLPKWKKLK